TGNWFAAAPRQPNRLALPRTHHKGENCYLSIRFKLLPIYRLDSSYSPVSPIIDVAGRATHFPQA
ncbi:hypothetical protein, partial [Mesorhizobium sp. M7A.F.Ca.ET.027.03.2.1]|uniref:hypothetical protein n=1 Tax=Mesorhizobium sp. M7A.F.Ca.ET.027.03.2.1 TaxID=2496656 RepID=UPI001AECCFA3